MNDFIEILTSFKLLKNAVASLDSSQLADVINRLQKIYDEKKIVEELDARKRQEREEALKAIRSIMAENRLTAEDLSLLAEDTAGEKTVRKRVVPPKYKFTDENGTVMTWTGQGRTPLAFRQCIEREGKSMEDYLIKHE
ncbi:H-NS histone family protein [uncultured Ruminobacter sp.]|uniref:H-NS histone family protein n=1 Tax=uncultured Ruminobacter sp. TaxID=538947 RepID=UPI00262304A2|nr:H-NS histone family protein [uncultured Ruminobacter sp.]MBQ4488891.1 H-NS histone family protein [Ruminobacter sp.]